MTDDEHDIIMEALLNLMRVNSIATGHGDTILELIATINASVIELRAKYISSRQREAARTGPWDEP